LFEVPFYETSAKDSLNVDDAFMTLIAEISQSIAPSSGNRSSITAGGRASMGDNNSSVSPAAPGSGGGGNNNKSAEKKEKSRIFGSLRWKSGGSPDFKGNSNNSSENGGSRGGTPNGDEKEKCTIS